MMARLRANRALDNRSYFDLVPLGDENATVEADPQDPSHTFYFYPNGNGGSAPIVIFDGRGFTYNPDTGAPRNGTVTSIEQGHFNTNGNYSIDVLLTGVNFTANSNDPPQIGTILRGNDTITGSRFADILDGFKGSDKLKGGAGADTFHFSTKLGAGNRDHILDFSHGKDDIALVGGIFPSVADANLNRTFHDVTRGAVQRDDRILYNHNTGVLSYDADGSGASKAPVKFAILDNHAHLTFQDFSVLL